MHADVSTYGPNANHSLPSQLSCNIKNVIKLWIHNFIIYCIQSLKIIAQLLGKQEGIHFCMKTHDLVLLFDCNNM
jgi:hypothetical protein